MTAWTFCCTMSCSTSCALFGPSEVSSSRRRSTFIFFLPTCRPPASLTSLTASSVAALKAPPIFDSFPVSGRTAPMRMTSWAEREVIRIGAVLPLTGKESKIGGAFKAATELAVKEVNDAGGLQVGKKKMKVDLRLLDDTSDGPKSAQLVEQLIVQQKVHAVIGGYGSQLVQAQSVVPERYSVPFISGGAGASSIYGRSKWVFGTLSPVESLAQTQMEFLADLQKAKKLKTPLKISLLKENTEHGRDFEKGVSAFVKAHPKQFSIVLDESFELYAPDFKPLLSRVEKAKGDIYMCDAHLEDYIAMQRQY